MLGKKGQVGDMFDFIIIFAVGFFLIFFIGITVYSGIDSKNAQVQKEMDKTIMTDNYLLEERIRMEKNENVDNTIVKRNVNYVRKIGYVPGSENDPNLKDVRSPGAGPSSRGIY